MDAEEMDNINEREPISKKRKIHQQFSGILGREDKMIEDNQRKNLNLAKGFSNRRCKALGEIQKNPKSRRKYYNIMYWQSCYCD